MKILFTAQATAVGGRTGHTESEDGKIAFDLAMPGSGKEGTNPEQLFALGYSACFDGALNLTAKVQKVPITGSKTSAKVGLGQTEEGGYAIDVDLYVEVEGVPQEEAQKLVEAAHQVCPYSKAVHGNVDVRLHVTAK